MTGPQVAVILVNWNRIADTLECIQSLRTSSYPNYEIIVVDNGSTDDSVERLRQFDADMVVLENGDNLGFTGGNNRGIECALERGADYVLLLNNDTLIDAYAIDYLVRAAESDPLIGIVSPKIRFYKPSDLIWFGGAEYNSLFLTGRMVGYRQQDVGMFDAVKEIPFASGCAMLIRRQVFEKVGWLCNDYFAVLEDIDFSLRVRASGWSVQYQPDAIVWHKESVSSGGHDAKQYIYYQIRNSLLFRRKWTKGIVNSIASGIFILFYTIKRLLVLAWQHKWGSIYGAMSGLWDGIADRCGRHELTCLKR